MQNSDYIELEKRREFGDIFSVTFRFIKQNFKKFSSCLLIFVLPFALISGIFSSFYMNSIMSLTTSNFENFSFSIIAYVLLMFLGMFISYAMTCGVVIEFFKLYKQRRDGNSNNEAGTYRKDYDDRLPKQNRDAGFTIGELGSALMKDLWRILLCTFVYTILVFIGIMFCIVPGVYLLIALFPLVIISVLENKSFSESFSYSFQLVRDNWWNSFLVYFLMSMIVGFASYIFYLPAYIYSMISVITGLESGEFAMGRFSGIFMAIYVVVYVLLSSVVQVAMVFQYYNLKERKEHTGLMKDLDKL